MLEIRLLGPLEVLVGGRPVTPRAHKQRALLADLVSNRGAVVSDDRLIDDVWGAEAPQTARHALRVYISELRKALPTDVLVTRTPGYVLELDPETVDAVRFERLTSTGRRALAAGEADRAAESLHDALGLWRGSAYADFTYEPWAQSEIARLEELRGQALELRLDAELALGRPGALAELEALASAHPLRERLHVLLMVALYRSGRQSDALAHYRHVRQLLVEELGLEPGRELRELEAAILQQDVSLLLAPRTSAQPQRKLATVLVTGFGPSSPLELTLDPEAYSTLLRRWVDVATTTVARHGGTIEDVSGETITATFGTRATHEDDALRAARAASELQEAAAPLSVGARTGIASGELMAGGGPRATGAPFALAAQLQAQASSDTTLVDDTTRRLTEGAAACAPAGTLELRGPQTGVAAFRLERVSPTASAIARRFDAPLVGRVHELARLHDLQAETCRAGRAAAILVHGPAGVGKTRLAREFAAAVDAQVLATRCVSYGEAAYAPLRRLLGDRVVAASALEGERDADVVADRLAVVLDEDADGSVDELPWAFRRFFEALARRRPLVLVLDDLQWADTAVLDVVDHAAAYAEAPILVVCLARDELLEVWPAPSARRLPLEPLDTREIEELAEQLAALGLALPPETRARLVATAEGNPLFLEQLLAHAAETGSVEPPPTLRALLASRLDRIGPAERVVLAAATVVGREGMLDDLVQLLDTAAAGGAGEHVSALEQRGLLTPAAAGRFRFRHTLIQDAAYRAIPKALRSELHARYANLLVRRAGDDEVVGFHLERAHDLLAELGSADALARRLARDGGARLVAAGVRALRRNDVGAGVRLMKRAAALVGDEGLDPSSLCEYAVALSLTGEPEQADAALARAGAAAARDNDRALQLRVALEQSARRVLTEPQGAADAFLALADEALPVLEQRGDDRALGRAWMLTGWVHGGVHCHYGLQAVAAERALRHYRRSGWPSGACLSQLAFALYAGPTSVSDASDRCRELLTLATDLAGDATVRAYLAGLQAMGGAFAAARTLLEEARRKFADLGQTSEVWRICASVDAAISLLEDDPAAAEHVLRESCNHLDRLHDRALIATQAADLAEALVRQGRSDEAAEWTQLAEANAASDDADAGSVWRSVRAKVLARRGEATAAVALARRAAALADSTDALNRRAQVQLDLAEVLWRCNGGAEADAAAAAAASLFETKGNLVAVQRVRARGRAAPR